MQYLSNENMILTEHDPRQSYHSPGVGSLSFGQTSKKLSHSNRYIYIDKPNKSECEAKRDNSDIDIIMRIRIENVFILSYPQNSL